ncbi:MAG: tRNA pseudouridine(55) synthase TruB [Bacteroidia bacterium]|nr:tRNA pseudouridine(55) synthase TruB [Bacteroidia bacterium]
MKKLDQNIDFNSGETLLFNKPLTWTSFDVVNKVRRLVKVKKVGHAGTLDPLATGLLILCTGKMTKSLNEIQATEKEYVGTFELGGITPSYDKETEVVESFSIEGLTEELVKNTTRGFIGMITQYAPAYSAVRVDGERAYKKARRGEEFKTKERTVVIKEFEITKVEVPSVSFRVVCGTGTYIRSLVNDFGKKLNNGAFLTSLCRTRIGEFKLQDAWEIEEFEKECRSMEVEV